MSVVNDCDDMDECCEMNEDSHLSSIIVLMFFEILIRYEVDSSDYYMTTARRRIGNLKSDTASSCNMQHNFFYHAEMT